jgi:hypothetical protein
MDFSLRRERGVPEVSVSADTFREDRLRLLSSPKGRDEQAAFEAVLIHAKLERHAAALVEEGFVGVDDLEEAEDAELIVLGLRKPELRRLRKALQASYGPEPVLGTEPEPEFERTQPVSATEASGLDQSEPYPDLDLDSDLAAEPGGGMPGEPEPQQAIGDETQNGVQLEANPALDDSFVADSSPRGRTAKWTAFLEHVETFDSDGDGCVSSEEMKAFLAAVGAWGSEVVYTDAGWVQGWPAICAILGADRERGLPLEALQRYHEKYRPGKLTSDLAKLADPGWAEREAPNWARLSELIYTFDTDHDGFIGADEMRAYLAAVGAWGSEGVSAPSRGG